MTAVGQLDAEPDGLLTTALEITPVPAPTVRAMPGPAARRLPGSAPTHGRMLPVDRWIAWRLVGDFTIAAAAAFLGLLFRFGFNTVAHESLQHAALGAAVPIAWVLCLGGLGAYNRAVVTGGSDEYGRVLNATAWLMVTGAFASYALKADFSRGFLFGVVPAVGLATLLGRRAVRAAVRRQLADGAALHRALLVGPTLEVEEMVEHVSRDASTGFHVCAVLAVVRRRPADANADEYVDVSVESILDEALRAGATTIALSSSVLSSREVRRLSWLLEGRGVRLFIVPSLFEVAGPRVVVNGLEGLPILDIREPQFTGLRRVTKGVIDRVIGAILLALVAIPLLLVAVVVAASDGANPIFRQRRIGLHGRQFWIYKIRTMVPDASPTPLHALSVASGGGAKEASDPRVTRVGALLRSLSIDELPQLWNVVRGDMSLVGPRPLVPGEISDADADHRQRRLLVKPGLTGLWQVSGRSNLTWDERMRLDLHYVDNWSVGLDCVLIWRTAWSVISGRGAF